MANHNSHSSLSEGPRTKASLSETLDHFYYIGFFHGASTVILSGLVVYLMKR